MTKLIVTFFSGKQALKYYMHVDPAQQVFHFAPTFSNRNEPSFVVRRNGQDWTVEGTDDPVLISGGLKEAQDFLDSGIGPAEA